MPRPRLPNAQKLRERVLQSSRQAFLIAADAAANLVDLFQNSESMAFLAIKDCERELDQLERQIDEDMPAAITRVSEQKARELLACIRFITDLERIGDLLMGSAQRLRVASGIPRGGDRSVLVEMAATLKDMLVKVHHAFVDRNAEIAGAVLRADRDLNRLYHSLVRRHFEADTKQDWRLKTNVLLIGGALERAGDHTQNLAEEVLHLIEGHTVRHQPKMKAES